MAGEPVCARCVCMYVHSRQYYGADLAFSSDFHFRFHFPLALLAAVSCVAEDDGLEKACPFAWVNSWLGRVGATTQGDGRSWDLSFVKATRWITQPVGWWGGDWGAARPGRRRRLDYAGWSINNNVRIHAGLICESCLYDVSLMTYRLQLVRRLQVYNLCPADVRHKRR